MIPEQRLATLAGALERELVSNILPYWYQTMDRRDGGFFGEVLNNNVVRPRSPKGIVMHSRHLWAYSTAWMERRNPLDKMAADHAFEFIDQRLYDAREGGFWWTVDAKHRPEDVKKVLYGQAFAVYGLSQYYRATGHQRALNLAFETFERLEGSGRDRSAGGYFEAVDRGWKRARPAALSPVDVKCAKSMNTNLHVLEAYSALYSASGNSEVRASLSRLVDVFETRLRASFGHLGLYFDASWNNLTDHISFGHDIEASWLLTEASELVDGVRGRQLSPNRRRFILELARSALQALQCQGGSLPNEWHQGHLDTDRVWWVQAEAMVGLINAWELTGDEGFLSGAESVWAFTQKNIVDHEHGEWFWKVDQNGNPDATRPKGGLWKTSYHNGRACLEVIRRAKTNTKTQESP